MIGIAALSLREAFRSLIRQKSTFGVAALTLALGFSVCTAMFCVLYGVILRPLSYGDPKRLVVAWAAYEGGATERDTFGAQALMEWRQRSRAFDEIAGFGFTTFTVLQRGEPLSVEGATVSPELFSVLAIKPEAGAVIDPETAKAKDGKIAMISAKLWRQRFNADPNVAGQPINLGGEIFTVIGVVPGDFDVPTAKTGVWVPTKPVNTATAASRTRTIYVVGRMKAGVSLAQGQADADLIAKQLATEFPDTHRGMRIHLVPYFEELVKESRQVVAIAGAAAFLTLLICCANVSNLLLVRAIVRRSEFATRLAIGAARRHLLAVVFGEGILLAAVSGVIGALLARWMIDTVVGMSPVELPRAAAIGAGFQIPVIAGVLIGIAALLVSVPAAWEVARARIGVSDATGTRSTSRRFARQVIVAIEVAVALTLVVGSVLMVRTIVALRDADPGWRSDHVFVATIALPRTTYRQPHQMRQFFESFVDRLRVTPGVVSVAASSSVPATPIGADVDLPIELPGQTAENKGQAGLRIVTPGLFKTLGIPFVIGRDFDASDSDSPAKKMIVNQAFTKKYLPNSGAVLGQQVTIHLGAPQTYEIVGVVRDVHHYGILQSTKPEFFIPFGSRPFWGMGIVVRTAGNPNAFAPTFYKELRAIDPNLPTASAESMEETVRSTWNDRRVLTILMVCFSGVVVALTIIGVFSVVRFSVSRQVREIAIHMAVGAERDDVVRLVMKQSARPVVAGLVLGLAGAWMLGRALSGLMYGVSANDPRVLIAATLGVLVVAGIAAYLPSRRAATLDPVVALRIS